MENISHEESEQEIIAKTNNTELKDITQHEIMGLQTRYNLADAHTHQRQSLTQKEIVKRLPDLWYEAEESSQRSLEEKFIKKFFSLQHQSTAIDLNRTMLFYAASIAMMTAGTFMMQRKLTVSLIEPCFDNLHDILKNLQLTLYPLKEELFYEINDIYTNLKNTKIGDVIVIVDPNNPTGFTLLKHGRRAFEQIIQYCKDFKKILMIDFCFAVFALMDSKYGRFDVYELLESSGVSYIAIEDTGKTWPIQDAKCALLTVSKDLHDQIFDIHTSVLLNVSPFILNLLCAYIDDSVADDFASIRNIIIENGNFARKTLDGTILKWIEPVINVSVAWFKIEDPNITAKDICQYALYHHVYLLSGEYFYWNRRDIGKQYIRIALARDPKIFKESIMNLKKSLNNNLLIAKY